MNQSLLDCLPSDTGLYSPANEHDSCGVGFIASIKGEKSNAVLRHGLAGLCHLVHRGAVDADAKTGDGAGLSTQIPYKLLVPAVEKRGHKLFQDSDLGVGVLFLPHDNAYAQAKAKKITEEVLEERGLFLLGWREVPVNLLVLGEKAQSTLPRIEQVLIGRPSGLSDADYEQRLYLCRKQIEKLAAEQEIRHFYIASFSHRVVVYKGLLSSPSLEKFYKDLSSKDYETALCVYHQRYSTNTFPTWPLCQPLRMLAHNGEINTRRGNAIWMRAREAELQSDVWGDDVDWLRPVIQSGGSDSSELDNAYELLVASGRDVLHSMCMLVPPAWRSDKSLSPELAAFYQYHRCFNEPWDGPAALCFTDGFTIGATLDRNGLRPARFKITDDGIFSLGSEVGTLRIDDAHVVEKGRLAPGEMIAVDTVAGKLLRDHDIKARLAAAQPYREWLEQNLQTLDSLVEDDIVEPPEPIDILGLTQQQIAFGYTSEELEMILKPMVTDGMEGVGSMGDDTPLAVLSLQPRLLYTYFKQLFAQVTNPPIDPIREKLVMSLQTMLGWRRNLLAETPDHAKLIRSETPVLLEHEFAALTALADYPAKTISTLWPLAEGKDGLEKAIDRICAEAEAAVAGGARLVILSDRGVDHAHVAAPMLLATGAAHHHLTRTGLRMQASLICETGEARDVHQIACLIGYGAAAICPYLVFQCCRELLEQDKTARKPSLQEVDYAQALRNYRSGIEKGVLKIMSKMGISVLSSYMGAQVFEALGISSAVVAKCFQGTSSQIEGVGFGEIAQESLTRHANAFAEAVPQDKEGNPTLADPGYYRFRRNGEMHVVTPPVIKSFHAFVKTGQQADYQAYAEAVRTEYPMSIREMFEFVPGESGPVPIDEVESVEDIRRRFTTAGMSLGALSPEAHEALAIAMNRIGGKSNSGEGGEDPERFARRENGDLANSAIKQVASGRFGVKAAYLASAKEIEIKMAQGSKPGEGGQLPGHKVSGLIAKLRNTVPGVMLISPPPHHDIYSIEDLAQLIHDLKMVNPRARICVKLVSEAGVGTVAAGVAKAHADIVLISGHDGGTGASPLSSIKNAGSAWELGIAEAQQVLVFNGLRNRVTLRTDGGMRTGRDIVAAALLGAEEYNFGTAALIAQGCVYVRQCHLNTCPVGIATQDERLRAKFKGSPEMIINFFNAVAQEVREIMASLGVRTIDEMIGHTQYLKQRHVPDHPKANTIDLSKVLLDAQPKDERPRYCTITRNDGPHDRPLDDIILADAHDAISDEKKVELSYRVKNTDRSIGTRVSGEIGYQWGDKGLPEGTLDLQLTGSAGQSLGAFLAKGLQITLEGEANDYVGKGMGGGVIVVRPSATRLFKAHENSIIGNTVLYGATDGKLFVNGKAGERFAVRNSGATGVVEGVGDHGCEYMTNGLIIVLGETGRNFGAGMTGGVAYVLDLNHTFEGQYNPDLIGIERLGAEDAAVVYGLVEEHAARTDSERGHEILSDWGKFRGLFWKVAPHLPAAPPEEVAPKAAAETTISEEVTGIRI